MILRKIFIILIVSCFFSSLALGKQETFPFLAQAINDKVNVRAGGNINFEKLCQLNKGDTVLVVDKEYSWYKVQIPNNSAVYITKKYIRLEGNLIGEVTATDVNVRAMPNVNASVVGRVSTGDKIYILEEMSDWYKIEPIAQTYGWISEEMLSFKTNDISGYEPKQLSVKLKELEEEKTNQEKEIVAQKQKEEEAAILIKVQGDLEERADSPQTDVIRYLILENQIPSYYLQGPIEIIQQLVDHRVAVEGRINEDLKDYSYPVLTIKKIQFVL